MDAERQLTGEYDDEVADPSDEQYPEAHQEQDGEMRECGDRAEKHDAEYGEEATLRLRRRLDRDRHGIVLLSAERGVDVGGAGEPGNDPGDPGEGR